MRKLIRRRGATAMLLAAATLQVTPVRAGHTLYAIGNSLTVTMLPHSIPGFASQRGESFNVGFYTISGAALNYLVANPTVTTGAFPVTLDLAFQGRTWTDISMEPYPSATSTLASDLASVQAVMNAATAGASGAARLFIYSAWPSQTSTASGGFAAYWRAPVPDDPAQPSVLNRSYADHLHARLVAAFGTTTRVNVIPVGDVLAALDDLIRAGQVDGITDMSQLYTDVNHVGDVGAFIAALTVYATVFRESPEGLAIPAGYVQGNAAARLTPALATQLESLVWRVVNADPRSGVNSAPVAASQTLSTPAATTLQITLAASDAEASSLAYTVVDAPTHGQLSGQAPLVTYMPDAGYDGPDSFSFKASDGGLDSLPATISIVVQKKPDAAPDSGGGSFEIWSLFALAGLSAWRSRRRS